MKWDGDLGKLDGPQLQKMMIILEQVAYGGDQAQIEAAKAAAVSEVVQ